VDVATDRHAGCTPNQFCRNPLHPGPCKGWKDALRRVAPGVPDLLDDMRRGAPARIPRARASRVSTPPTTRARRRPPPPIPPTLTPGHPDYRAVKAYTSDELKLMPSVPLQRLRDMAQAAHLAGASTRARQLDRHIGARETALATARKQLADAIARHGMTGRGRGSVAARIARLRQLADDLEHGQVALVAANDCGGEFCRAPLHPGPCKGWKQMLGMVAPGVPALLDRPTRRHVPAHAAIARPPARSVTRKPPVIHQSPAGHRTLSHLEFDDAMAKIRLARNRLLLTRAKTEQEKDSLRYLIKSDKDFLARRSAGYNWDSPFWSEPAGRVLDGPIDPAEMAAKIDTIVADVPEALQPDARKATELQAQFTPRAVMELSRIGKMQHWDSSQHDHAWAYYDGSAGRVIQLRPEWGYSPSSRADMEQRAVKMFTTNWWSRTDSGNALISVLSHEYGHHVHRRIKTYASHEQQTALMKVIDEQLGASGRIVKTFRQTGKMDDAIDDWLKFNPMGTRPSTYGMKSPHEFMAEVWHEYTTALRPRRFITAIGDIMRDISESTDLVAK